MISTLDPGGDQRLPTTAYAILALLRHGPLTSQGIVQRFHVTYAHCWDRTDALLYEQTRRLRLLGHVTVSANGPPHRHAMTAQGLAALDAWLAAPSAPP